MRIFVGYGYNDRDSWIETQVYPILRCMGFTIVDGKDEHGAVLQRTVEVKIEQSDAAIGFFTLRDGQGDADFNSHIWVRDEMVFANAKGKPIVPIKEDTVRLPAGLLGDRQYIPLRAADRLACVAEMATALGRKGIRRLKLEPGSDDLARRLWRTRNDPAFVVRYRTQDPDGVESDYRQGRLELFQQGFYLNVAEVPRRAYIEVEGLLNGAPQFTSGWVSADAVQVKVD